MLTMTARGGRPPIINDQLALELALSRIRGGLSREEAAKAKGVSVCTASRLFRMALEANTDAAELLRDEAKRVGIRLPKTERN